MRWQNNAIVIIPITRRSTISGSISRVPLPTFISRLDIMCLTATQLTATIQCNVFRSHRQPGAQCATVHIEGINLLPDSYKEVIDTLFGILGNTDTIQNQTNKIKYLTRIPGDECFQRLRVMLK